VTPPHEPEGDAGAAHPPTHPRPAHPPTRLIAAAMRFSAVGAVSYVIDVAVFNLLRVADLGPVSEPLVAKTIGVVLATLFAWLGSRYYTFRQQKRPDPGLELIEFVVVAALGYVLNLSVLYLSHYVLGFHSLLADNLAANVIGALLGSTLRFMLYRYVVYRPGRSRNRGRSHNAHSGAGR
jgi:putative flippase GtrA